VSKDLREGSKISAKRTPKGESVIFFMLAELQVGFCGGAAAKVSPAVAQSTKHAFAVIWKGDSPASKIGDGSLAGAPLSTNASEEGSIAYCQEAVASYWRSTALELPEAVPRTVCLRGMSKA
jgi:hypothetical protein